MANLYAITVKGFNYDYPSKLTTRAYCKYCGDGWTFLKFDIKDREFLFDHLRKHFGQFTYHL
jgi:hypothetical protein